MPLEMLKLFPFRRFVGVFLNIIPWYCFTKVIPCITLRSSKDMGPWQKMRTQFISMMATATTTGRTTTTPHIIWLVEWEQKHELHVQHALKHNSVPSSPKQKRETTTFAVMRRSNRNFNIPPGKPRAFDYVLCLGVGNLICKAFPGVGIWLLPGCGGENWAGSVRLQFFFRSLKLLTAMNTCFDEKE